MFTGGFFLVQSGPDPEIFSPEKFSEIQQEFARAASEFALNEIYPKQDAIELLDQQINRQLLRQCGELGLLGIDVPEDYGGLEMDKVTAALVTEKITMGQSESFMVTYSVQTGIGMLPILFFGNEEQKKYYLPKLVSGEWISAYALTEPGSGSDALSIRTSASYSDDGEKFILNGSKQFISNGGWADVLITFAKIDGEKMTCLLVDPRSPGVVVHEEKNKLGLHGSSTANITLENVEVPKENVLGEIGKGAEIAFNILNIGRFKLGAAVLGGSKSALQESVRYALERKQFGQPVAYFEALKKKTADMTIRSFALESAVYQTAGLLDKSIQQVDTNAPDYHQQLPNAIERFALECSICKVFGSEAMGLNTDDGLQMFGGYGFMEEYPLARMMRDTRVDRIYEGTNEINRQIILGYLLKKTLLEELPIREKMKDLPRFLETSPTLNTALLKDELNSLEASRHLLLFAFKQALTAYGQDLLNKQQIGEWISDMVIHLFTWHTTLSRVVEMPEDYEYRPLALKIGRVYSYETAWKMLAWSHQVISACTTGQDLTNSLNVHRRLQNRIILETNINELKNEIADEIYNHKKYPFNEQ
ncbi:MAG: acyl-CoA dehydrogenase FadE [Calditrichia bacterium]